MDIKKSLSHPASSVICFLFSLLGGIAMQRIFLGVSADKSAIVLMTHNFLHGHGFTLQSADLSDLSQTMYMPFHGWPPGYNLLLSPFLAVMEENYMMATFMVDITVAIIFFIYLRKLLVQIGFPVWLTNLFLLFQGFFIHTYIVYSSPTDYIGMTFMTAGIFHIVKFTSSSLPSWKQLAIAVFFFCAAAFTRYQYMPVVILLGLFLAIQGRIHNNKQWVKAGLVACSFMLLTITALLLYQKMTAGQFAFLTPAKSGFYPANLVIYPFITRSFVNIDFYATQLSIRYDIDYLLLLKIARWPDTLLLIFLTGLACVYFTKKTAIQKSDVSFRLFGGLAALLTIGVLVALALTQSTENIPPLFGWNYLQESRYFAFPALCFQVIVGQWLLVEKGSSLIRKVFRWLLIVTASLEILHGSYFVVKKISAPMTPVREIPSKDPEMVFLRQFLEEEIQKNGRHVVATGFSKRFGFTAGRYGGAGMYTPFRLNDTMPRSSQPAVLLVALKEAQRPYLQSFLKQPGVKLLRKIREYYFYVLYVEP